MPGLAHIGWTHKRYRGDMDAVAPYIPLARKVLGFAIQEAKHNGLLTYKVVKRLDDGTLLVGELVGGIPRMTIEVAGRPPVPVPTTILDDFIIWPRDESHPDVGIDPDHPQQILRINGRGTQSAGGLVYDGGIRWKTYFFNEDIDGYAGFSGSKGIYAPMFTDGVRYYGNVDWCGKDEERLSWYGPSIRYWLDAWREADTQYGPLVFLLGQVLLNIEVYFDAYSIDYPEKKVVGACFRSGSLYVMLADIPSVPNSGGTSIPTPGRPWDVFATVPWPDGDVTVRLMRFGILTDPSAPEPERWQVAPGSHMSVWDETIPGAVNPWFFDPEGNRAVTVTMPLQPVLRLYVPDVPGTPMETWTHDPFSESHDLLTLMLNEDGDGATLDVEPQALEMAANGTREAIVAADYDMAGQRVDLYFGYVAERAFTYNPPANMDPGQWGVPSSEHASYFLRLGSNIIYLRTLIPGNNPSSPQWAFPLAIDARVGAFVLEERLQDDNWNFTHQLRILYDGRTQATRNLSNYRYVNGGVPLNQWQKWTYNAHANSGRSLNVSPLMPLLSMVSYGGFAPPTTPFMRGGIYDDNGMVPRWWNRCRREQRFGAVAHYSVSGAIAASYTRDSYGFPTAYYNDRADFVGFITPMGMAAADGVVLYCGAGQRITSGVPDSNPPTSTQAVDAYATDSGLDTLSGVDGDEARYHPISVLGKPPKIQ